MQAMDYISHTQIQQTGQNRESKLDLLLLLFEDVMYSPNNP
tara:strand:+ start:1905 stop:2027 length:123 start_codon:yes stop_codon:yes gene_type:complete